MLLAIVNGGLGLQLAKISGFQLPAATRKAEIGYGVVAGVVALAYIVIVVLKRTGKGMGTAGFREKGGDMELRGHSGDGPAAEAARK
jgi:hypothetical protein